MSIASANIQICRAVRDLVYSSSTKRQQDRISLCVESITRSSSQLRDLLLAHEFLPKLSADQRAGVDVKQVQGSKLSGFFGVSEEKNLNISTSPKGDKKELSPLAHTPRSSVERELLIPSEDIQMTQKGAQSAVPDASSGDHQEKNHRRLKSLSPSPSSPSSSKLLSAGDDIVETTLMSQAGIDSNLNRMSPEHFSPSPLSISSSSLVSTSSLNIGPEPVDCSTSVVFEGRESGFVSESEEKVEKITE